MEDVVLTAESSRLILAAAALFLSLVIFFSSRMIARAHYMHQMQNTWNAYNSAILSSDELMNASIELGNATTHDKGKAHNQKISLAFLYLNALQAMWIGNKYKLVSKEYADANLNHLLNPILVDDEIYSLTQNRGYHPGFSRYCKGVKESAN